MEGSTHQPLGRDVVSLSVVAALATALWALPIDASERVLPTMALAAVAIGIGRSRAEAWSIDAEGLAHRRAGRVRRIGRDEVVDVTSVVDEHGAIDAFVVTAHHSTIVVPAAECVGQHAFAGAFDEFVAATRRPAA